MSRCKLRATLFVVLLFAGQAGAEQRYEPREWLVRMSHGFRELNYSGLFTYEFGDEIQSLRIVHANVDGIERERLVHLDGPMLEFVRDGHKLSCVHVGDRLVRLDHAIPAGPFAKKFGAGIGSLEDHYDLVLAGNDRVAGMNVVVVEVRPRDGFRFGYQLALEEHSALLLRSVLIDAQQRVLERFQFVEVSIGGEPDLAGLTPSAAGHRVTHHLAGDEQRSETAPRSEPGWQVSWLPGGFTIAASDLQRNPLPGSYVGSEMYTDGLAVFSVFVERSDNQTIQKGSARRGATVAFTTPMVGNRDNLVTVVGEVPLSTARRVANSVSLGPVQ